MATRALVPRVWVVDDSPLEVDLICRALSGEFDCEVFADGSAVLERLAAGESPDVLLLDWVLPGMSGVEMCRFIRTTRDEVSLPILLLTSHRTSDDVVEGLSAGANDYVLKPYVPAELLARAKTLARTRRLHRSGLQIEAQLAITLRSISDGVISTDAWARVRFMNQVAEELTGWSQAEALDRPLADVFRIVHEATRATVESPVERVLREGTVVALANHTLLVRRDGSEVSIDDSAAPIRNELGELTGVVLVFRDIGEKKRAEAEHEALLASTKAAQAEAEAERRKLHAVFTQSPLAIAILEGPGHTFTFANPAYGRLVGGRDVVGKPLLEALPELRGHGFDALLDGVVATGDPFLGQAVPVKLSHHGEDEWLYVNVSYQPKRNAAGAIEGVLVSAFEVTEQVLARQHAETAAEALRQSEDRLRRVVEASGAGLWDLDVSTGAIDADRSMVELMGLPEGATFGLASGLDALPADDRERVAAAVSAALAGENGGRYLTEFRTGGRGDAPLRWVESRANVFFDEQGKAVRLAGAMIDVTHRKQAEAAQAHLLAALADQPLLYVALVRGSGLVFEATNKLYRQIVGGRDVVGKRLLEALPELEGQGIDTLLARVLETGEPFVGREMHVRLDRRGRGVEDGYFNFVYQAVRDASEANSAALIIGQDVTDEVLARREAQRAERERADFERQLIGIVSHDLRTPLGAILLGTQLLRHWEGLDEKALEVILRIESSAERGSRMVRDLLDFTQARLGGGIALTLAPGDLHAAISQVVDEVGLVFPDREVRVQATGDGHGTWDLPRLSQVVLNLVSNALKYSPSSSVVTVQSEADEEGVTVSIHNTGAPIAEESLARIFQPMQRATSQLENTARSVGLGLFIVKHLVDAHGGQVSVSSTHEGGTTFTFWVPKGLRVVA